MRSRSARAADLHSLPSSQTSVTEQPDFQHIPASLLDSHSMSGTAQPARASVPGPVARAGPCENFLYGFKAAPRGRTRRRHGAHASASAGARTPAAPTPVGWRERRSTFEAATVQKFQGRGGFDKGTLAMAQIGLMRAGQKPVRSPYKRTGHRPLSNPPLCFARTLPAVARKLTLKRQRLGGTAIGAWARVARDMRQ